MSRIPTFPFRVLVHKKAMGSGQLPPVEIHNYTSFAGAVTYRTIALRRPNTRLVEIVMVIDETTPASYREDEEVNGANGARKGKTNA